MRQYIFLFLFLTSVNIFSSELEGLASWYGPTFHGKLTANGETFNTYALTAAHKTLPLNTIVKVTSLKNSKEIIVRINDRGPFIAGRVIDLSKAAAVRLDMLKNGVAPVRIEVLKMGDNKYYRYSPTRYQIQVGSFTDRNRALDIRRRLKNLNVNCTLVSVEVNSQLYHRVQITNLTYGLLQKQRLYLHDAGIHDYIVRKDG